MILITTVMLEILSTTTGCTGQSQDTLTHIIRTMVMHDKRILSMHSQTITLTENTVAFTITAVLVHNLLIKSLWVVFFLELQYI